MDRLIVAPADVVSLRGCPVCPGHVPAVTDCLASRALGRLPPDLPPPALLGSCAEWLTRRGTGLPADVGLLDRPYRLAERLQIEGDLWRVYRSPCPFATRQGCRLGGLCTPAEWEADGRPGQRGWLPTTLLRMLNRPFLRDLAARRQAPDAKLAAFWRRDGFPIVLTRTAATVPEYAQKGKDAHGTLSATLPAGAVRADRGGRPEPGAADPAGD